MKRRAALIVLAGGAAAGCAATPTPIDLDLLQREVWNTELSFARSMAERDFSAFGRHLSEHAVFWSGGQVQRGKVAVLQSWRRFFDGAQAPFSWQPDEVVVIGDGSLAQSSGPVRDSQGQLIARFRSVWRREADGRWLIVLDRGEAAEPPKPP
jgi:ketosteroid isomerase-like protein